MRTWVAVTVSAEGKVRGEGWSKGIGKGTVGVGVRVEVRARLTSVQMKTRFQDNFTAANPFFGTKLLRN